MATPSSQVDVRELREALHSGAGCQVLDVREYPEFAAGRVRGSKLIPLGELDRRAVEIERASTLYVICRTGRRSAEAQQRLMAAGFADVRNVVGGMTAWQAAGFEVDRDAHAPWSLERQVRFVAGVLVVVASLLSVFVASAFVWLAVLVGAGLVYAAATDTCAMGELLAKLPFNRRVDASTCLPEAQRSRD